MTAERDVGQKRKVHPFDVEELVVEGGLLRTWITGYLELFGGPFR